MKKIICILTVTAICIHCFSQGVAINDNGAVAHNSAVLDVSGTAKGLLTPRMTTAQRTSIAGPAEGLLVYDTDTKGFWFFSSGGWLEMPKTSGGSGFTLPYSGSYADPNRVFSIVNTSASANRVAIYGKGSNVFTGLIPGNPTGVWGEEDGGIGVMGTSNSMYGIFGRSQQSHGIFGSTNSVFGDAGVYGTSTGSNGIGVKGEINNGGNAVYGVNNSTEGSAGVFQINNINSPVLSNAVRASTNGLGRGLLVQSSNPVSTTPAATITSDGLGRVLDLHADNTSKTNEVLFVNNKGKGTGIYLTTNANNTGWLINGYNNGTGGGISVTANNASTTTNAIEGVNKGTGTGIFGRSENGNAAVFWNTNAANSASVMEVINNGTSVAGEFTISNSANSSAALSAKTNGSGPGLMVESTNGGTIQALAIFKKNGANRARIDGVGKGFFNGGTQVGGADMAEVFDVEDNIQDYETGDVLVISLEKDRAVIKSAQPYSTLVAGVYATKPGVLMTEEDIETDLSSKVPMGVLGVIPTKVCSEGGEIKRGDLLVTSSLPGVAMKADMDKVKPGQVIGKALENFNGTSTGKIKVLVNVK